MAKILTYSKRQEERLIKQLEDLGWQVLKHYGDREKNSGDVLARLSIANKRLAGFAKIRNFVQFWRLSRGIPAKLL